MKKYSPISLKISALDVILLIFYLLLAIYFILKPPIYSPDTTGYFHVFFYRYPVYGLFLRLFYYLFGTVYDVWVVAFQLLFGYLSIHIFSKTCKNILKLSISEYVLLLAVLIFPYFSPLLIGNNLTSEGLSYPFYLFFLSFTFEFIFNNKPTRLLFLFISFVILCLIRGQFIFIAPILAFLYILKYRKNIFKRPRIFIVVFLFLMPIVPNLLDKTYHKVVHGYFVATPFVFVNGMTLPLYISEWKDANDFKTQDQRAIFLKTYPRIDSLGLLASQVNGDATLKYATYQKNLVLICNQTFHAGSLAYFKPKEEKAGGNVILVEKAAKEMIPVLIKNHFKDYITIYLAGVFHGFYGKWIFVTVILIFFYSFFIILKKWSLPNGLLFFASSLLIANACIVAFASYSIMRLLFYNYFFAMLIAIILVRKIKYAIKT